MRLVLDTSVLIDHLRGCQAAATDVIPSALARGDELWSSHVVRTELLAGMRPDEETPTRDLLRLLTWAEVNESVSEAAGALGRSYLRSHQGIYAADLIAAALAQELEAKLLTVNVKHFPMIEGLKAPY